MVSSTTVREAHEGERRWFCGGGLQTWKVTEAESDGAFLLFEDQMEAGKVTPLHIHPAADETFYLLEGSIRLHLDGEERSLDAGGVVMIPRGVPHAFMVTSPEARMLCLQNPGSGEKFFLGASDPVVAGETAPAVDFGRVQASAEATGAIEILGPPPF
jgi:quercetin dioxygenase-like cupin family protein